MKSDLLFGMDTVESLIEKAERDLNRFCCAKSPEDMRDHGINTAIAINHICDWTFFWGVEKKMWGKQNENNFKQEACENNINVKIIRKIANLSKHHTISGRSKELPIDRMKYTLATIYCDTYPILRAPPGGTIKTIQTITCEEEMHHNIICEGWCLFGEAIGSNGQTMLFGHVCHLAIDFWKFAVMDIEANKNPSWFN